MFVIRKVFNCSWLAKACRNTISRNYQVSVLGGSTDVGKSLLLMLRNIPSVEILKIHDYPQHAPGVILDLSHIPSSTTVVGYCGEHALYEAIQGSDLVLVAGNSLQEFDITNKSPIETNRKLITQMAEEVRKITPMPFIGIASEPMNKLVPMASELLQFGQDYRPEKLFGITIADTIRAQALYGAKYNIPNGKQCEVPVIGGHSSRTSIPLLSQAQPKFDITKDEVKEFTSKFRQVGNSNTWGLGWCPVLPMAYGAFLFTEGIINALSGKVVFMNALVANNDLGTSFFSGQVFINENGVKSMRRYTNLSSFELLLLETSLEQLRQDVAYGKKALELL